MLDAGPERSARFARAIQLGADPYWTARVVFCSSREEIAALERAAAADPASASRGPSASASARDEGSGAASESLLAAAAERARSHGSGEGLVAAASSAERLAEKRFEALTPDELAALRALTRRLSLAPPERRTRRARRGRRGERLDVRATLRRSLRTGGDPVEHARRRRRTKRRRLVLLLDVSGSMEPYSRAFLHFLEGGVGGAGAEAFVFATRLTRLTRALRGRDPQTAIARASAAAPDWSGGTRIGAALKAFNDLHARRGMARGAVV